MPVRRVTVLRIYANALAELGETDAAIKILEPLAEEHPRDAMIQEAFAQRLVESSNRALVQRSIDHWRNIARHSRPHTERWYRAKYFLAVAHVRLGNPQRASEILRWVQAMPSGFEGTSRKRDFELLLEQVGAGVPGDNAGTHRR